MDWNFFDPVKYSPKCLASLLLDNGWLDPTSQYLYWFNGRRVFTQGLYITLSQIKLLAGL